jgi:formamidopyrimidine-DNA glycosylase
MPELPEVETVARDLQAGVAGRRITAVEIRHPAAVASPSSQEFAAQLTGKTVGRVWRRAKFIVLDLEPPMHLVVHLRMTGRLLLVPFGSEVAKHTHVVLGLTGDAELHFRDTRRFGRMWLVSDDGLARLFAGLGPEPLDAGFSSFDLASILAKRRTKLKPLLLDQGRVAGLGNIYADEALFGAGLHPCREAGSLSADEVRRLHASIRSVLGEAVQHRGTSLSDAEYRDAHGEKGGHQDHVAVFRRQGRPCPRCGGPIQRIVLGGRSTHFCPSCQPDG